MDLIFWSWPALTLALIVSVLILSLVRRSPFRGGGSAKNGNGTCHTTNENNTVKVLPSPARMPIIGHLYLFQGYVDQLTKFFIATAPWSSPKQSGLYRCDANCTFSIKSCKSKVFL